MDSRLKVSIITVCYNTEKYIEEAIKSVLAQTYPNIEYIVIDGRSTDDTLRIIEKYKGKISKVISEKDDGIYDAMNKGIRYASGDVLYFLNADDRLYGNDVIDMIVGEFKKNGSVGIVCGKAFVVDIPSWYIMRPKNAFTIARKDRLMVYGLSHQRIFARRWVFERTGFFNVKYKISADYDWMLTAVKKDIPFLFVDQFVAYVSLGGISGQQSNVQPILREKYKIIIRHSPSDFILYVLIRLGEMARELFMGVPLQKQDRK